MGHVRYLATFASLALASLSFAEKLPPQDLIALVQKNPKAAGLAETLAASLGTEDLKKGTATAGQGGSLLFAIDSPTEPQIVINGGAPQKMQRVKSSSLWMHTAKLTEGTSHAFYYMVDGKKFGGRTDVPAYLPECYRNPQVPEGKLSGKLTHTSALYDGMVSEYWTYAPAAYNPATPAGYMIWQDGQGHINRDGAAKTLNVIDNLTHQKKIPVLIHVFIAPGMKGQQRMRSIEYDTLDDLYTRFLRDEILVDVGKEYNLRADSYSHAIAGNSSGGICAFNAAWFHPELFSRVLSHIGSFTSIQWKPGQIDGGNVYPFKIRKEPKRNIRVWLQDGMEDLENSHGSWPLQNVQMANSLKMMSYDFHFSISNGTHNGAHGNAELPRSLAWLWRGYDLSKTEETFAQEPEEKDKPLFRVRVVNRD